MHGVLFFMSLSLSLSFLFLLVQVQQVGRFISFYKRAHMLMREAMLKRSVMPRSILALWDTFNTNIVVRNTFSLILGDSRANDLVFDRAAYFSRR